MSMVTIDHEKRCPAVDKRSAHDQALLLSVLDKASIPPP
jgi:hypothetical protein